MSTSLPQVCSPLICTAAVGHGRQSSAHEVWLWERGSVRCKQFCLSSSFGLWDCGGWAWGSGKRHSDAKTIHPGIFLFYFNFFFHEYLVNRTVSSWFSNKLFHVVKILLIHRHKGKAGNGAILYHFCTKAPSRNLNIITKVIFFQLCHRIILLVAWK